MGFGKFLVGGLCAVGAIIAAPVVLPAAAAAGALAAGAAAATGAAAMAGVAATGTALVGAAAATGATIGGTMAAVGVNVGLAAGAVGLTSVATVTGTAAGAAAVGTIATTGAVGVVSSASGAMKLAEAKEILEDAEYKYNNKKAEVDHVQESTNEKLEELGNLKVEIWNSFKEFIEVVSEIKNCHLIGEASKEESFNISKDELDQLENLSISVGNLVVAGTGAISAGAAASLAAYGGTMVLGTASTGTAIGTLTGVAATNATLASLGGGSLAVGGLGMAGGTVVLGTLVAAPALAVGGLLLAAKGSSNLEKAKETKRKSDSAIKKFDKSLMMIKVISDLTSQLSQELRELYSRYSRSLANVKRVIKKTSDFSQFSDQEKKETESLFITVKLLKVLTTRDLLVKVDDQTVPNHEVILADIKMSKEARV